MAETQGRLMVADTRSNADMLYATGLIVPDAFVWCDIGGEALVIANPLEVGRMKRGIRAGTQVVSLSEAQARFGFEGRRLLDQVLAISRHAGVTCWEVPASFPLRLAEELKAQQIDCRTAPGDFFFPEREFKREDEVAMLTDGVRLAEHGLEVALDILREATVADGLVVWQGAKLTAEILRGEIDAAICRQGGTPVDTIVAPGPEGADPHNGGHGPIRANEPLILDIFPRVTATGYWGDLTRTVVKGMAPEIVRRAFEGVREARDQAKNRIRDGADAKAIHEEVSQTLARHGFASDPKADPPYGFFHGTGHGLGLEIHELPRISTVDGTLKTGHVVTVEPGLYYREWGGVRLEDVVVVTDDGCHTLTSVPTFLEIA